MARPRPEQPSTIRFGWLEAFVAVAHHGSYFKAGEVLGVDRTAAKRSVEMLEYWTRRVLVMDDGFPHILSSDGEKLMPLAVQTLCAFENSDSTICCDFDHRLGSLRKSNRSKVSINAFKSLSAFKSGGNVSYDRAGAALGIGPKSVRSDIRDIKRVWGFEVVAGFSSIKLTEQGAKFLAVIEYRIKALEAFRSVVPSDHDLEKARAERHHALLSQQAARLHNRLLVYKYPQSTINDQIELIRMREIANTLKDIASDIKHKYGPFKTIDGSSILID